MTERCQNCSYAGDDDDCIMGENPEGEGECEMALYLEPVTIQDGTQQKAVSRTRGLSMSRAVRAFCWECCGGTSHVADCNAPACPLYAFRFKDSIDRANLWWKGPTSEWKHTSQMARRKTK